ncbi:MAG: response regulator [Candidatus Omnitrophica bacterium]|nr:response regulator [Candidatus Omnitrophota bacterium]
MYRILIVDDEPEIVNILELLLKTKGFEVVTACGGAKGIEAIKSGIKIDLLVLDKKMPKLDGLAVLKELKKSQDKIPVIILTGSLSRSFSKEDVKDISQFKISYLSKPIEFEEFVKVVNRSLGISND